MAVATLAILPATAQAVPITGTLDLVGRVRVTATTIEWLPLNALPGDALILGATDYFLRAPRDDYPTNWTWLDYPSEFNSAPVFRISRRSTPVRV